MKTTKLQFATIPVWALPQTAGRLAFFETIALSGLEGRWIRLDAATQRALIGFAVFGKQEFMVSEDGMVSVRRSCCFGTDFEVAEYDPIKLAYAADNRLRVSPGVYGPGMFNGTPGAAA